MNIDDNQWDDFLAYVPKLLEEHPIPQADSIVALRVGNSVYQHYQSWQHNPINMVKSLTEKVCYLLDEKLQSEPSFNMMREQIKQQYL